MKELHHLFLDFELLEIRVPIETGVHWFNYGSKVDMVDDLARRGAIELACICYYFFRYNFCCVLMILCEYGSFYL